MPNQKIEVVTECLGQEVPLHEGNQKYTFLSLGTSAMDEHPRGEHANKNPECRPWGGQKELAGISCCTLDVKTIVKVYFFSRLRDC